MNSSSRFTHPIHPKVHSPQPLATKNPPQCERHPQAIALPEGHIRFHSRPICSKTCTSAPTHHLLIPFPTAPMLGSQLLLLPTMSKALFRAHQLWVMSGCSNCSNLVGKGPMFNSRLQPGWPFHLYYFPLHPKDSLINQAKANLTIRHSVHPRAHSPTYRRAHTHAHAHRRTHRPHTSPNTFCCQRSTLLPICCRRL